MSLSSDYFKVTLKFFNQKALGRCYAKLIKKI